MLYQIFTQGTIEGKYNELTNDGIKDYIKYMQEQGKKTSTISRGLAAISVLCKQFYITDCYYVISNFHSKVKRFYRYF